MRMGSGQVRLLWGAVVATLLSPSIGRGQAYMLPRPTPVNRTNPYAPNSGNSATKQIPFQGTATIAAIGARGLKVTDANGNTWTVQPEKNCKTEVTGTADPDFLATSTAASQFVRFSAEVDRKTGKTASPVNELEILSPQIVLAAEKERGGLIGAGSKRNAPENPGSAAIVGHIRGFKNNQLMVDSPVGMVTVDLASNPTIKVTASDVRFAQPGDKVDVIGYVVKPGEAVAQEIRVTLSNPLGSEATKKKPTKSTTASK